MNLSALATLFVARLPVLLVVALLLSCSATLSGGPDHRPPRTGGGDPPEDHPTSVLIAGERWLEAECATAAANRAYVTFPASGLLPRPQTFGGASQLTYTVNLSVTAAYKLFFRLNAPEQQRSSVWVSIDDGPWVKFSKQRNRRRLSTQGFEWREVVDNGTPLDLRLSEGEHTIRVAARESGLQLDKIFLSPSARHPAGLAVNAPTCAPRSASTFTGIQNSAEEPLRLIVFPELFGNTVRILFPGATLVQSLIPNVFLFGSDGREYPIRPTGQVFWVWGSASNELVLNIGRLPPGAYTLRVGERIGRQSIDTTFMK